MSSDVLEIELPRAKQAASVARRQLERWFDAELDSAMIDAAKSVLSELVNNSVLHGTGTITLRAALDDERLLVEVIDEGSGFERTVSELDFEAVSGRGLHIVDAEASRWGVHEGTTHVWFELDRPGSRSVEPEGTGPCIGESEKPADL